MLSKSSTPIWLETLHSLTWFLNCTTSQKFPILWKIPQKGNIFQFFGLAPLLHVRSNWLGRISHPYLASKKVMLTDTNDLKIIIFSIFENFDKSPFVLSPKKLKRKSYQILKYIQFCRLRLHKEKLTREMTKFTENK